jgi:hypothetical protein
LAVACDLGVFTAIEREAHTAETGGLMKRITATRGLDDGWELELDAAALPDLSRWFIDERRCCPFLSLHVDLVAGAERVAARLRGPEGTKELLRAVAEGWGVRLV